MVNDPVIPYYDAKREMWRLHRGNETFYDNNRNMREWETEREAREWAAGNLIQAIQPAKQMVMPL